MVLKRVVVLGSTGSIGTQALEVIKQFPGRFTVVGLSAHSNIKLLENQVEKFKPRAVAITSTTANVPNTFAHRYPFLKLYTGSDAIDRMLEDLDYDILLVAISNGIAGIKPTITAIRKGSRVALATKEVLVCAGEFVRQELDRNSEAELIPVDSEHSAIWQLLEGEARGNLLRIILTASGGPFLGRSKEELKDVSVQDALNHPRWNMGSKISVDSATLMNKGLEVIEAHYLFGISPSNIDVWVHPEAIVHGLVVLKDGSMKAAISTPDMRIPIAYALSYPERLPMAGIVRQLDADVLSQLRFLPPDTETFPALKLAYGALEEGLDRPCVLNAANDEAVHAFLRGEIPFLTITDVVQETLERLPAKPVRSIEDVFERDREARQWARKIIRSIGQRR